MKHILVALVQDEPGILARMGNLFARRGYNVESFTAGASEQPGITRVTIVVEGSSTALDQVAKQFRKLIGAVKVGVNSKTRQEVVSLADLFKARIVDVFTTTLILEATGDPDKLNKFLEVLRPFGIKEQARTGAVFMRRGAKVLNQRPVSPSDRKYLAE